MAMSKQNMALAIRFERAAAEEDERAAVVAWLRQSAKEFRSHRNAAIALEQVADEIGRGLHRRTP